MRATREFPHGLPAGSYAPCTNPRVAAGGEACLANQWVSHRINDVIHPGCWACFAAWPLGPDNPPRRVAWISPKGICGFEPRPGWRTYARSFDLVLVVDAALQAYIHAGGRLVDLPPLPTPTPLDEAVVTGYWEKWDAGVARCSELGDDARALGTR